MQSAPYDELDPLAAYGVSPLPVQLQSQQQQQELQQQELQQQQGVPTTGPTSYMASVTLQQGDPSLGLGPGSGSDSGSDSGMGANPYAPQSVPGASGAQQGGSSDPFTLLREAVDRAAAAIAAASGAAAHAAVVEAAAGGAGGMGQGQGQGGDDESGAPGAPGGQGGQGGAGSGVGAGQGGSPGVAAGAGGALEATQRHKLVSWTDFSKGVTACGQRGDPSYNQGMFLAVDTALGAENVW